MLGSGKKRDRMGDLILASPEIFAATMVLVLYFGPRLPETLGMLVGWLFLLPFLLLGGMLILGLLGGVLGFVLRR